jgi:hypothetical protein
VGPEAALLKAVDSVPSGPVVVMLEAAVVRVVRVDSVLSLIERPKSVKKILIYKKNKKKKPPLVCVGPEAALLKAVVVRVVRVDSLIERPDPMAVKKSTLIIKIK